MTADPCTLARPPPPGPQVEASHKTERHAAPVARSAGVVVVCQSDTLRDFAPLPMFGFPKFLPVSERRTDAQTDRPATAAHVQRA